MAQQTVFSDDKKIQIFEDYLSGNESKIVVYSRYNGYWSWKGGFQVFIICQLVIFVSKAYPYVSVLLTTVYEDVFKKSVSLKAGS